MRKSENEFRRMSIMGPVTDATERQSTFVVTHVDDATVVLRDVHTAQVHPVSSAHELSINELTRGDVLEATLRAEPPLDVSWQLIDVTERRTIDLIDSDLEPTTRSKATGADLGVGELSRIERAGTGEIHVLRVSDDRVEETVQDILEDEETIARAARLAAVRVEVRCTSTDGIVSVRYLPD